MEGFVGVAELAERVGVSRQAVSRHAKLGHFAGAVRAPIYRDWLIPVVYADKASYAATIGKSGRKRASTL